MGVLISMAHRISLRVFRVCLIACAMLALGAVWFNEHIEAELYFQTTATLFIVGLASFLIWFSLTLTDMHLKYDGLHYRVIQKTV